VLVIGELRRGIDSLRRRDAPQAKRLEARLADLYAKISWRILPVSAAIAERWGRMNVPEPFPVVDGLLAATALEFDISRERVRQIESNAIAKLKHPSRTKQLMDSIQA
jgi:predicted nucleic acid-binding protein